MRWKGTAANSNTEGVSVPQPIGPVLEAAS